MLVKKIIYDSIPSLEKLLKIAKGLNAELKIDLIPKAIKIYNLYLLVFTVHCFNEVSISTSSLSSSWKYI